MNLATIQVDASAPGSDLNARNVSGAAITNTQPLQGVVSEAPAPRDTRAAFPF